MTGGGATSQRWSDSETTRLLHAYAAGEPINDIAQRLGRPEAAITNRLHYLRRKDDPRVSDEDRRARPWTAVEDAQLDRLLASGDDLAACSKELGRPLGGVEMRVRKLAETRRLSAEALEHPFFSPDRRPIEWSDDMDARLAAGWAAGETLDALGLALGVAPASVHHRVGVLRSSGLRLPPRKPRWTAERRAHLAQRREEGASMRQLAAEFGVTHGTITYHVRRLRERSALPDHR